MKTKKETPKDTSSKESDKKLPKLNLPKYRKPIIVTLCLIILVLAAYLFKGLFFAAVVNGKPLSRLSIIKDLERQGGKQTLDAQITKTLIYQEAARNKVTVPQGEIDQQVTEIETSLTQQGQTLDNALAAQNLTREDMIEQIRLQKLIEKMLEGKISITQEEIDNYIKENQEFLPEQGSSEQQIEDVRDMIKQQKYAAEFQSWIAELKQTANIDYFVKY